MRAIKKLNKRGFTLVELMIVVAIIGVLAALAIYGVRRYLASAKTAEAKNSVGAIARGSKAAFEKENAGSELIAEGGESAGASNSLCESAAAAVPVVPPAGKKYQPVTADGADFNTGSATAGWRCLNFSMSTPHYFSYNYTKDGLHTTNPLTPTSADFFEASAMGDLDGDTTNFSTFSLVGEIANGQFKLANELWIDKEAE